MTGLEPLISAVLLLVAEAGAVRSELVIPGAGIPFKSQSEKEAIPYSGAARGLLNNATTTHGRLRLLTTLGPDLRDCVSTAEPAASLHGCFANSVRTASSTDKEATMSILSAGVILKKPQDSQDAANGFGRLGFEVTTISDGVLLLTADASVFESAFGTALTVTDTGAQLMSNGEMTRALPLGSLPTVLREMVSEAEFEAPPDFGPGNF